MSLSRFANFKSLLASVLGFLLVAPEAMAADWPQFRGPNRDGHWDETGILESFPRKGLKIRWRQPVGGGWASPVVSQGRAFVLDVQLTQPTSRERLHCFNAKTGKMLWTFIYETHYSEWTFVPERGAGPTATPIVEEGRIYTVGAYGFVHCLDVKTGKVIWKKDIGQDYIVEEMSCRPSPLIEGPLLIVFTGAKPGATVMALDKQTGKEVWKSLSDHVSNSSPIAITSSGRRQLIVWTDNSLASLDPADGQTFWREPMTTSNNDDVAAPVFWGIICS
jgi:outer membrane protein assembly factor BamB